MPPRRVVRQPPQPIAPFPKRHVYLSVISVMGLIALFCMVFSKKVSSYMLLFLALQHHVPIPGGNGSFSELSYLDRDFYEIGWIDICTLIGYTLFLLLVSSLIEDQLLTNIVFHGLEDATKRSRLVIQMTFYCISFIQGLLTCLYGHFGWWQLWNGYTGSVMPFVAKQFLLTQLGFYASVLIYQSGLKADDDTPLIPFKMEVTFHVIMNLLALNGRCSILPLVTVFTVPHVALQFVGLLSRYTEEADDGFTHATKTVCRYGTLVENIWMPLMTLLLCIYGGSIQIIYRVCLLVLCGIWAAFNILIFYYQWLDDNAPQPVAGRRRAAVPAGPLRRSPRGH